MPVNRDCWVATRIAKHKGNAYQVNVTTAPTLIAPENDSRFDVAIFNNGTSTVYISFSEDVNTTDFPLPSGMGVSFENYVGSIYGIVTSGTQSIGVMEV
jgi:hypothetical protein